MSAPAKVPYAAINRFENGFMDEWMKTVENMSRSAHFIGGDAVKKLEAELAAASGSRYVKTCGNGTDAMQVALRAMGVGPGDVVALSDFTFWATFEAVVNVGAKPVTVDIDPSDLHMSAALAEEAIKKFKPKALILVHLYGWAARDTFEIRALCKKHGVKLLEDSAQAWGVEIKGEPLFKGAEICTTSFYPAKVLGAAGDGGAIFTNDAALAARCEQLENHGRATKYSYSAVGWNSRLDALQAAFLSLSLKHVDARIQSRRQVCQWYQENFKGLPIEIRTAAPGILENGYISVAMLPAQVRPKVTEVLEAQGIGHVIVYPGPMSTQEGATPWLAGKIDHGHTDLACRTVLSLPCFAYMTEVELHRVKEVVGMALQHG